MFTSGNILLALTIAIASNSAYEATTVQNVSHKGSNKMTSSSATSWGILEILPNSFLSINYKKSFRISVYRSQPTDGQPAQYFYSPALIIDPSSAVSSFNTFTKRYEMTFTVLMWDDEYEETICAELSKKLNATVPRSSVRTLPIEEIRMDAVGYFADYEIVNKWTSYASQPALFKFRLNCLKKETCQEAAVNMQADPEHFVSEMVVYYSLRTQKSSKKVVQVKLQHVQSGSLFTALDQKFPPGEDIVYMKSDDVKRLTLEISTNVLATEVTDDEFVSQDQSITLSNLLESLLKIRTVSTDTFEAQMWNSVFWQDENSRPDKITASLNQVYNKSDSKLKEIIKDVVSHQDSSSGSGSASGSANILGIINVGGSASGGGSTSAASMTQSEKEKLVELLTEAQQVSQWAGDVFKPKPMQLSRTNLAALRTGSVVTSTQFRVTKTSSELTSRINLLYSPESIPGLVNLRSELHLLNKELNSTREEINRLLDHALPKTGSIRGIYSTVIPVGWLACDGAPIDCTLYPALCALVGNFTPDLRGRFPIGYNASYANELGQVGGEAEHRLTVSEMPSHNHEWSAPWTEKGGIKVSHDGYTFWHGPLGGTGERSGTSAAGDGLPHNNLPPFLAINFVIKT